MNEHQRYEEAWAKFRFLNRRFWLVYLGYIPIAGGLSWLVSQFTKIELLQALPALSWMVYWAYCGKQRSEFICPQCGCKFFSKQVTPFGIDIGRFGTYYNSLSSKCLNCGLSKYTFPGEHEL